MIRKFQYNLFNSKNLTCQLHRYFFNQYHSNHYKNCIIFYNSLDFIRKISEDLIFIDFNFFEI